MREILFRGKRKDNGEWTYGYYGEFHNRPIVDGPNICQIFEPCEIESKLFNSMIGGIWRHVDRETVGQFTGLTDKNGKKVFEGDIVTFEDGGCYPSEDEVYTNVGVVVYGEYMFTITNRETVEMGDLVDCSEDTLECEVIGNIYDNPELLEEK